MLKLNLKRKNKEQVSKKQLGQIVDSKLESYVTVEFLQQFKETLEKDKRRLEKWNSLSSRTKGRLLLRAFERMVQSGKK